MKQNRQFFRRLLAVAFWLTVWQAAAMAIGQEVFLVSPVQALRTLVQLLPRADFWQRVGFSSGRILLGFVLGAVVSVVLAVCAARWSAADALLAPVMQLVKATPVASFIILALVWVRGSALSVLISFLMVLPVLYGAVRTGIASADVQLLEMAAVFRLPPGRRLRAVWLPAVLPAFRQGCSVALGICWKSGVAAEVIGLPNGSIGDALYRAKITLSTGELFAWTFVNNGYSFIWFYTLYFMAAYFRKYRVTVPSGLCLVAYLAASAAGLFNRMLALRVENALYLNGFVNTVNGYQALATVIASAAMFLLFQNIRIRSDYWRRWVFRLAPLSFGVYLLHDSDFTRALLWQLVDLPRFGGALLPSLAYLTGAVLLVAAAGYAVDAVYQRFYRLLRLPALETKLDALTARILQSVVGDKKEQYPIVGQKPERF